MRNIIGISSCIVVSLLSTAAMAQDQDAAAAMGAGSVTTNRAICQDDGECKKVITECEKQLEESRAGARAANDVARDCRAKLNPVVPPPKKLAPPAPPSCSGEHAALVNGKCECHVGLDGTGDIDPALVPVPKFGYGNLVECVSGSKVKDRVEELKGRFDREVAPNVPGWNAARDAFGIMLSQVNVPIYPGNPNPDANSKAASTAAMLNTLWQWYVDEARRQQAIDGFLNNDLPSLKIMRDKFCPPLPGKPNATWEERCEYGHGLLKGSKVEFRAGARGGVISTPGAGVGSMAVASAEFEVRATQKTSVVVGGYIGGINNHATGGMMLYGMELGPRFYLDDERRASIDILVYVQGRTSVNGAGHHGMPSGFMGRDGGLRPRFNYCLGEKRSVCLSVDGSAGYGTGNAWTGAYKMDKQYGPVFGLGLGVSGHTDL